MVQVFQCGGDKCPKGGEHIWDGPEKVWTNPCSWCEGSGKRPAEPAGEEGCPRCSGTGEGGGGSSATCSKCGLDAMSHTLMNDVGVEWPPTRLERVDTFVAVHLVRDDGTSWCSMTKLHGPVSAWPATDQSSTQLDQITCKACLGRHHRDSKKEDHRT
jgi:hypothetical protein